MRYLLVIKEEAHNDSNDAYEYYENIQPGLGDRFLDELIERYNDLMLHPQHYGFIAEDRRQILRDVRLKKFPYLVVFEIIEEQVVVYAVHNAYKHPDKKLRKK